MSGMEAMASKQGPDWKVSTHSHLHADSWVLRHTGLLVAWVVGVLKERWMRPTVHDHGKAEGYIGIWNVNRSTELGEGA